MICKCLVYIRISYVNGTAHSRRVPFPQEMSANVPWLSLVIVKLELYCTEHESRVIRDFGRKRFQTLDYFWFEVLAMNAEK